MKKRVVLDFETRSQCNLKAAGAFKYSLDPSTRPTCLAFKKHGEKSIYFLPFETVYRPWKTLPEKFRDLWTHMILGGYLFVGHNVFFERSIYENVLVARNGWPRIDPRQWRCTAAKAAACALPRSLEGVGEALKLVLQKDKRGFAAMMATCKPTKAWNAWKKANDELAAGKRMTAKRVAVARAPEPPVFITPESHPEVFTTLYTYCKIDVKVEEKVDDVLPDLIPSEQEIWFLNQQVNWRGINVDIPTIQKITTIMEAESKVKLKQLDSLTMGLVTKPGARKSILEFLALDGIVLPDIKAKTVQDALGGFLLNDDMKALLEIRQALSKTSTKKYKAFLDRANPDGRVRDILLYHGASTGRDTGTGIQVQNFPRGLIKVSKDRPYAAVSNVIECHQEMLRILYGDNLSILFSSILRNMITASPGKELFVADFSKIEVAVLWWLAGNEAGLEILRSGKDPYIYQAAKNTGKTYEDINAAVDAKEAWAEDARQLGKAQILGGGFGMGWSKFQSTAQDMYRLKLTDEQSKEAIASYREANPAVPILWKAYERAAIKAVRDRVPVTAGKCKFFYKDKFLWVVLPSGRPLAYREPQISWRQREFEETVTKIVDGVEVKTIVKRLSQPQETLEFWGVNSKTKKWALERTWGGTWAENITQAVARDLMKQGSLRLEKAGYQSLLDVHDEGICEKEMGKGDLQEFIDILCQVPAWGVGLPLEAKGWQGPKYKK